MLDLDLAELYAVETRALVQAVKRNRDRFPIDFMFQLSKKELEHWRSQIVITNPSMKMGLRRRAYALTEQGVAMLSSVLRSKRAVEVNILIMRAFVRLLQVLATHKDLAQKLEELEKKYARHDKQIRLVFQAIQKLLTPEPPPPKRQIGFRTLHS